MFPIQPGWYENKIYPGTHWMFYNQRMDYVARVDFGDWTKGRYMWRVMDWSRIDWEQFGFCETLEEAQVRAERVFSNRLKTIAMKSDTFEIYVQEALFGG